MTTADLHFHIKHIEEMFVSTADWEIKYDRIFDYGAQHVWPLIKALCLKLEYYDPDTSYQEDVTAYVQALRELQTRMGNIA